MNLTLKLDNVDFSSYIPQRGYTVSYKKVLGSNSVTTLDGKFHEDVLAYKARITTELKPMTSAQLALISNACDAVEKATYYDPKEDALVTKDVIASLSSSSIVMNTSTSTIWNKALKKGIILTIEER